MLSRFSSSLSPFFILDFFIFNFNFVFFLAMSDPPSWICLILSWSILLFFSVSSRQLLVPCDLDKFTNVCVFMDPIRSLLLLESTKLVRSTYFNLFRRHWVRYPAHWRHQINSRPSFSMFLFANRDRPWTHFHTPLAQPLSHLQPLICDSDRCFELFRTCFFRNTSHTCMCVQWLFTFLPQTPS